MGKAQKPGRVKLVIGMIAENEKLFEEIEEFFVKEFGDIDYRGPFIPFDYTDYYTEEMGPRLKRRFVSFNDLISPERISDIKVVTNSLEEEHSVDKGGILKRRINIDPGYLSDSKFILATTKDYSHRIYLKDGIYAEITLVWKKGSFQPYEWTYPDYRTEAYIKILTAIRDLFMKERELYDRQE